MVWHSLKIKKCYFDHIVSGSKKFEVRLNDRDYQAGDRIFFRIADDKQSEESANPTAFKYQITYVHHGLGVKKDYVILGIEEFK